MNLMDNELILERLQAGEDSRHQFKLDFSSVDGLAAELAAFANTQGGWIFVGVDDEGHAAGISSEALRKLNQWVSNASSQKIEPPLMVYTQTVLMGGARILIVAVPRGAHKPYAVNKTQFWVKSGADKRRATREELFRLMQSSHRLYADEMATGVSVDELDVLWFSRFYRNAFDEDPSDAGVPLPKLLENLKLAAQGELTLAGLLLFGKYPMRERPTFSVKATVYFPDHSFGDKEDIGGNLFQQYRGGVDFILRNLRRPPVHDDFNAPGKLEIPAPAIREVLANALVHRDYFLDSCVFVNVFDNRVEIVSPGCLPNTVTVENIRYGIHVERNPILLSLTARDPEFGYTGRGAGVPRVLRLCKEQGVKVDFINDTSTQTFRVVFGRKRR